MANEGQVASSAVVNQDVPIPPVSSESLPVRPQTTQSLEHCDVPVPAKLASFEPPALWEKRGYENSKMELMSIAAKSTGTAYALWILGGLAGYHRFYLGKFGSGIGMLLTLWLSAATLIILIGFVGLFAVFVWWVVDAFCIGGWVKKHNERVARLMADITSSA